MLLFKSIKSVLFFVLLAIPFWVPARAPLDAGKERPAVRPHEVVFKLKGAFRQSAGHLDALPSLEKIFAALAAESAEPLFPLSATPSGALRRDAFPQVDLSLICRMRYHADVSPFHAAAMIRASGIVDYAEPFYLQDALYTPNDPQ